MNHKFTFPVFHMALKTLNPVNPVNNRKNKTQNFKTNCNPDT